VVADLAVPGAVADLVLRTQPGLVVNCAALADVDRCEALPFLAHRLNTELPEELAVASAGIGAGLIHISTDAVFGAGNGPYHPSDAPSPVNAYGRSKAAGEKRVLDVLPEALVVRTNVVGWSPTRRRSLLEFFWDRLATGAEAAGFVDVSFRPIAASDLWSLLNGWLAEAHGGIRHATGSQLISKYDFALNVARTFGFDESLIRPSSIASATLGAARAPSLDVVPSPPAAPPEEDLLDIDFALLRLRALAARGYRDELAAMVSTVTAPTGTHSWTS